MMEYQQLRRHLQSPRRIQAYPLGWECEDPESESEEDDPHDWTTTPQDWLTTLDLVTPLPSWSRIVSALTAAEMVLPIWEESAYVQSLTEAQREGLRRGLATVWLQLNEEASETEVRSVADAARREGNAAFTSSSAAGHAAYTVQAAAEAVYGPFENTSRVASAAHYAANAAEDAYGVPREEFYSLWWCNVKKRLAIMGLERSELEWWEG